MAESATTFPGEPFAKTALQARLNCLPDQSAPGARARG